jgi:hypothetical protein
VPIGCSARAASGWHMPKTPTISWRVTVARVRAAKRGGGASPIDVIGPNGAQPRNPLTTRSWTQTQAWQQSARLFVVELIAG